MIRSLCLATAACGLALVMATGSASAAINLTDPMTSATLQQILDQAGSEAGKFIVGDKEFRVNTFLPAAGAPIAFSASSVLVTGRDNGLGGTGFRLTALWVDNPGDSSAFGFTFEYDVSVLAAYASLGYRITGVNLAFNGFSSGLGSIASVDESVFSGPTLLGTTRVSADGTTGIIVDSATIPVPQSTSLNVIKDFKVFSPTAGGQSRTSFIEQTFRQVPAPGAGALAVMGLSLIARRRR